MLHFQVGYMPMKFGLELMTIICPDHFYPERERINDVVNKVNCTVLSVFAVDFKCSDSSAVINSGILKAFNASAFFILEKQEFDIDLNMMLRNLLLISFKSGARAFINILEESIKLVPY